MSIDLQPFCANRFHFREVLRAPFTDQQWVYATNGHLAVRVPRESRPDVIANKGPGNIANLFARAFEREGEFLLMPPLPASKRCEVCDGTGFISGGEHYPDDECAVCLGCGTPYTFQRLGDSGYCLHYLHLLSALPQVRIRTDGIGPQSAAALIFDGGEAILMPMKEK